MSDYRRFIPPKAVVICLIFLIIYIGHISANAQQQAQQEYSKSTFGSKGSGSGEFFIPWGITIIEGCCLFVADYIEKSDGFNTRVQSFNTGGKFFQQVLDTPSDIGGFAAGANDYSEDIPENQGVFNLYITLTASNVIVRSCQSCFVLEDMDNAVAQLTSWRVELSEKEKNIVRLIKDPDAKEKAIEGLNKKNELMAGTNITADLAGNVYVVDSGNNEIRKYTDKGNFSWSHVVPFNIEDITVDPGGEDVYVSDNRRIIAFDSERGVLVNDDKVDMIINDISLNIDAITVSDFYFYALDTSKEIIRRYDMVRCYVEEECIKDIHYNDIEGVTIGRPINIDGRTIWKPDMAVESFTSDRGERIYITDPTNHRVVIITEDKL